MAAAEAGSIPVEPTGPALEVELAWIEGPGVCLMTLRLPAVPPSDSAASASPPSYAQVLALPPVAELVARLGLGAWSVFGRKRLASDPVCAGDRVELLPPLQVDPKQARLRRLQTRRSRR